MAEAAAAVPADMTMMMWPKSPEPTAVGAVRSAVAVHAASRRRFTFLRQASLNIYQIHTHIDRVDFTTNGLQSRREVIS